MYHFKKLIEVARTQGVFFGDMSKDYLRHMGTDVMATFWNNVETAEVFCFSPKNKEPIDYPEEVTITDENYYELHSDIDAPFKVFSIEMVGEHPITSPHEDDRVKVWVNCIMCVEHEPKRYMFFALTRTRMLPFGEDIYKVLVTAQMGGIVTEMLKRIRLEKDGLVQTRERVKIGGTGTEKRVHTIRRIIYITPKRQMKALDAALGGRKVDWSHRWNVRGHWRTIEPDRIGKDREGCYCVAGHTWVSDYAKGPESKEAIHKVRFVST